MHRQLANTVRRLEEDNPTESPTTCGDLLNGEWKLRYTDNRGTRSSIAGWETVAGAVTDVRQRFEISDVSSSASDNDDDEAIRITNVVTVSVPPPSPSPLPLPPLSGVAVRITQRFEATVQSKSRVSTRLLDSNIDVISGTNGAASDDGIGGAGLFGLPLQMATKLAAALGGGAIRSYICDCLIIEYPVHI